MVIGVSGALVITVSQAEMKLVNGRLEQVVPTVTRHRAHHMRLVKRCLWVGVPAGLVGGGIGYLAPSGVHLGAAFLGALVWSTVASIGRQNWAEQFGRAGENAQLSDMYLQALVGGLGGAVLARYLCHDEHQSPAEPELNSLSTPSP
jgi:hypothetical protein